MQADQKRDGRQEAEPELQLLSSNGATEVLPQLLPVFERAHRCKVSASFGSAKQVMDRILGGEPADLYMVNESTMDELASRNKIIADTRRNLTRCGIGVAVRAGAPQPDIGTLEAFRQALLDAESIAYTSAASSGIYFTGVIERLGIAAEVKAKARTRPAGLIGELLVSGEAALAVQHVSELMAVRGIDLVGPFPAEVQIANVKAASVAAGSRYPELARALLDFLGGADASSVWEANGYEMCTD